MKEQIKFSWDIHYACNYRCPYCWFNGKWHQMSRQNRYLPLAELIKPWENIYKKYGPAHINILGGEPFIYPHFTEIITELSKMHSVGIVTNLSADIENFVMQVDSSKVNVTPTFHPLFADFDKFIKKELLLKEKGFCNHIFYLAYPPQVKLIKYYADKFNEYGLNLKVLTFWGQHNGKDYPQGYSQQERQLIDACLGDREGEKFQLEPQGVKGKLCRAGQLYANIKADGSVFRCGGLGARLLGNFFDNNFEPLNKPAPCESEFCPCNEWAFLLVRGDEAAEIKAEGQMSIQGPLSAVELRDDRKIINRKSVPPHHVFVTWDIHYGCNYNCTYCNTPKPWHGPGKWDRDRDKVIYPGVDKWIKIWEDIYKRYGSCEIHITGGEPFIYPSFMELITQLSKMHTLEIITNLFWETGYFIKNLSPDRVRIGTSFHPEFANLDQFLKKHLLLRENGFETWANYVAYPPLMSEMGKYKSEFDRLKISFNIQPYLGWYQDREYPAGYTDSEMAHLKSCYNDEDIVNKKTIEWKTGVKKRNMSGKPCRMGQMYAKVYPIADAYRCCAQSSASLGNLIDGSFKLSDEPLLCKDEHCFCWRCMLVGEEDSWAQHWVIPHNINTQKAGIQS